MIIIIPIGGTGQRFKDNGYTLPKALIKVFGKPILYYLIESLNLENVDFIYIPYNKEYANYNFESQLTKDFPDIHFKFLKLNKNTRGAAETLKISLDFISKLDDKPILSLDSDGFYTNDIVTMWGGQNCVFSFKDTNNSPVFSYIKTNEKNIILDIKEKIKISDNACCGAYGFASFKRLKKYADFIIENNILQKGEFYISGVIKELIKQEEVFNKNISKSHWTCLGTPLQLKLFYNNYPQISSLNSKKYISKKRICFDLDNTLVTFPKIKNDYTSVEPIQKNIDYLKYLKKLGNTIIIYTARRMKTHKGNIGKINKDIGIITFNTLDKFSIPYDEIYFGKPYADFYIDDLAISAFSNLEKELGYYLDEISPRKFNQINQNTLDVIVKTGNSLSGEIYYYENIPIELKDMFPIFISNHNKSYTIEKINGITCTNLYLSQLLNEETLNHILNSIRRIQGFYIKNSDKNINIYSNYADKLKKRYNSYDYSRFKNSESLYNNIKNELELYEKNNLGKQVLIHGDCVMTNILINNYGKIKFIDMRGQQGDKLSLEGDWLYDWAKIYQSLIGYDKILQSKTITVEYEQKMLEIFETYFLTYYSADDLKNLKLITKSLLFTLIPLHDNEKCSDYYKLITLC